MELIKYSSIHSKEWDNFVNDHPDGNIYHLSAWKSIVENTYGWTSYYYMLYDKDKIIGIVPFFEVRGINFNKSFLSLPYASYAGILLSEKIHEDDIYDELGWNNELVSIRKVCNDNMTNDSAIVTMVLDLPEDSEELWGKFKAKVRNQVRKAEKSNIEFVTGKQYLDDCIGVYSKNMKRLGTPVHKNSFFRNILEEYKDNSDIWAVTKNGRVVGAMLVIYYKNVVFDYVASTLPEYNRYNVNMMLYWGAIKKSIELGLGKFDFGRSTRDTGTYKFKKQWGTKEIQLDYYVLKNGNKTCIKVPQPGKLSKIWSKSPEFITNWLGPRIRRYIY